MTISTFIQKIQNRFRRYCRCISTWVQARRCGISFFPPNYLYRGAFNADSVIIDVGCGYDADFSMEMIKRYNLRSFGIDPTQKHQDALHILSERTGNLFIPIPLAVSADDTEIIFHESSENVSGSIRTDHVNVKNDTIHSYLVQSRSLHGLMQHLQLQTADYLKLDLEGAEYELIRKSDAIAFDYFKQVLIEFHHHCIDAYSINDTHEAISNMCKRGFIPFSFDGHNFLFYRM